MDLKQASCNILHQLEILIAQTSAAEYTASLELLSGSSIGKHVRHILEFYLCLTNAQDDTIDYDARIRDTAIEQNPAIAQRAIVRILECVNHIQAKESLGLWFSLSTDATQRCLIATSFERELAYNIEHAIHHFAIIKMAVLTYFPEIVLPPNFGIAYSTVQHQTSGIAQ